MEIYYIHIMVLIGLFSALLPSIWFRFGERVSGRYYQASKNELDASSQLKKFPNVAPNFREYDKFLKEFNSNYSYFTKLLKIGEVESVDNENYKFPVYDLVISTGLPKPILVFVGGLLHEDILSPLVLMNVFTDWLTKEDQMDLLTLFDYHFIPLAMPKDFNKTMNEIKLYDTVNEEDRKPPEFPQFLFPEITEDEFTVLHINNSEYNKNSGVNMENYKLDIKLEIGDQIYAVFTGGRDPYPPNLSLNFLKNDRPPNHYNSLDRFTSRFPDNYGFDIMTCYRESNYLENGDKFWFSYYGHRKGIYKMGNAPPNTNIANNTLYFFMTVLSPCSIKFDIINKVANFGKRTTIPICHEQLHFFNLQHGILDNFVHTRRKKPPQGRVFVKFDTIYDYIDNEPILDERGNPFFNFNHEFRHNKDYKAYGGVRPFGFQESRILRDYMMSIRHRVEAVFLLFSPLGFKDNMTEAITFPWATTKEPSLNYEDLSYFVEKSLKEIHDEFPTDYVIGYGQTSWYLSEYQYGRFDDWIHSLIKFKPVFNLNFYYMHESLLDDTRDKLENVILDVKGAIRGIIKEMAWGTLPRVRRNRYRTMRHNPFSVVSV